MTAVTTIETTVRGALEAFGVEPALIRREARLADLGVDSLDVAELAQIVEDEHSVRLTGEDMKAVDTVGDAIDLIARRAG
jgi:acyl carrier protein